VISTAARAAMRNLRWRHRDWIRQEAMRLQVEACVGDPFPPKEKVDLDQYIAQAEDRLFRRLLRREHRDVLMNMLDGTPGATDVFRRWQAVQAIRARREARELEKERNP
jgi:hypothetical protein